MSKFYFGQAFNYDFFVTKPDPFDGFEDLSAVTDAPTVYIYDERPNRDDALTGGGTPIQTIGAWTDTTVRSNNGKRIAVASISDPNPQSDVDVEDYWIAVNYVLVNSGDNQLSLRRVDLYRPGVVTEPISITTAELEQIFPGIDAYVNATSQESFINVAIVKAKTLLDIKGFEWAQLRQQNDLNQAITFMALSLSMRSLVRDPGDRWATLADDYGETGKALLQGVKLAYDSDRSGGADIEVSKGNYIRIRR